MWQIKKGYQLLSRGMYFPLCYQQTGWIRTYIFPYKKFAMMNRIKIRVSKKLFLPLMKGYIKKAEKSWKKGIENRVAFCFICKMVVKVYFNVCEK